MPRRLTPHDLTLFLTHLSRTGNFALAAARTGRGKSGLYKRRAADPAFASRCDAALTLFRANQPSPSRGEGSRAILKTTGGELRLYTARQHPPQLRRAQPGHLTPAGIAAFLRSLAATANVRLSAQSVGVAASSVHARRRRDEAFRAAWDDALKIGTDRLELALMGQAANRMEGLAPPAPGWEDRGLDFLSGDAPELPEVRIAPMSVDDCLRILTHHIDRKRRQQSRRPPPTLEDLRASVLRKIEAIRRRSDDEARAAASAAPPAR